MAVRSVIVGWKCERCGINRNTVQEVHKDCVCGNKELEELVEVSNKIYWNKFWNR